MKVLLEKFQHRYDAQRPLQFAISFRRVSCFEYLGAWLNMDQGHLINSRMVKFVVSCCVVSKQVEVSTVLVSVESTGSWLHAGTCLAFVCQVVLEILHDIVHTHHLHCT